jgi:hypothetical protein
MDWLGCHAWKKGTSMADDDTAHLNVEFAMTAKSSQAYNIILAALPALIRSSSTWKILLPVCLNVNARISAEVG